MQRVLPLNCLHRFLVFLGRVSRCALLGEQLELSLQDLLEGDSNGTFLLLAFLDEGLGRVKFWLFGGGGVF